VRADVFHDLRASRFTAEHKLPLNDYLLGADGRALLGAMAADADGGAAGVARLLEAVRPLEFYMPVPAHRESWTGGTDLLVASQLEDDADVVPTGFTLAGAPVALSRSAAPATPTLVLVPVETDFGKQVDVQGYVNRDAVGGGAIGTYVPSEPAYVIENPETCLECGGGGGGSGGGTTYTPGLYMTKLYVTDTNEPWTKGSPEIEVHIHGPATDGSTYGDDLGCAGEHASYPRSFDQNDNTWTGNVLLFTQSEIEAYNLRESDGFNIMIWEDDDTACTLKYDKDFLKGAIELTKSIYNVVSTAVKEDQSWEVAAGRFIAAVYNSASWLLSNDDWIGVMVDESATSYSFSDANHVVFEGSSYRGRANLILRGM
jgi:hypothetical protein